MSRMELAVLLGLIALVAILVGIAVALGGDSDCTTGVGTAIGGPSSGRPVIVTTCR